MNIFYAYECLNVAVCEANAGKARISKIRTVFHTQYEKNFIGKLLQPMIGLHKGQVTANLNYYNNMKQNLLKNHPRMKEETAEKKALEQAKKYAQKQKEYRAATIARTELVRAYNAGEYYGIKQAQYEGLLGKVKKFAVSAGDGGNFFHITYEKPLISLPETVLPAFFAENATFKQFLNGMKFVKVAFAKGAEK